MSKSLKMLGKLFFVLLVLSSFSLLIATPIFAPTKEVHILGANSFEENQLKGFKSVEIAEPNKDDLDAASFLVLNLNDNSIITKRQSGNPLPIASLTKLMTVWVTLKYGSLEDSYTIQIGDGVAISPALGLTTGDEVKIDDLVKALLIGSANDAAQSLGGYVESKTGQTIAKLMNDEIMNLGLKNSRFQNPVGFDSVSNYSSADDIAILVQKLKETGVFNSTWRETEYSFKSSQNKTYSVSATNKLIDKYSDLYAIKTGFTNTALGSMVNILKFNNQEYLLIVIGSPDRESETLKLRNRIINK